MAERGELAAWCGPADGGARSGPPGHRGAARGPSPADARGAVRLEPGPERCPESGPLKVGVADLVFLPDGRKGPLVKGRDGGECGRLALGPWWGSRARLRETGPSGRRCGRPMVSCPGQDGVRWEWMVPVRALVG
ncbi:hypothetical protein NDU88_004196 [Pleurodeles waltl]|uniref:Uncharacterized protein n=1 Tax=Pleurodeles waltl TaxID=8319 RepID=A0AAV7PDA6_PLEWA|nr:hypothetical protein NDU88_004196 [Pleurodeles waltl]